MSSCIKMRCKKRELISEDISLGDSYCHQGELEMESVASRTTSYSSCAVHLNHVCPIPVLYTRFIQWSLWILTLQTRGMKRCVNGDCFQCLPSWDRRIGKGSTDRGLHSACWIFNNFEAHLLNLSHAVSYNNSSDKHAPGMRFSSVWFQIEIDCTSGRRADHSSCNGVVFLWVKTSPSSPSSCHRLHPSPSDQQQNGLADHSQTSWKLGLDCHQRGSYCDPWRCPRQWPQLGVYCPSDQRLCA